MSDPPSYEMCSVDRPPNRFQVNPVNHRNNSDNDKVPNQIYPLLTGRNGERIEDDTFNEETAAQLINKQPRQRWVVV